jgi:hypothetical protein
MRDLVYTFWVFVGVVACVLVSVTVVTVYRRLSVRRKINRRWRALPTLTQYTRRHPGCVTGVGPQCVRCNSPRIKDRGMAAAEDKRRRFVCDSCGKSLYRNEG